MMSFPSSEVWIHAWCHQHPGDQNCRFSLKTEHFLMLSYVCSCSCCRNSPRMTKPWWDHHCNLTRVTNVNKNDWETWHRDKNDWETWHRDKNFPGQLDDVCNHKKVAQIACSKNVTTKNWLRSLVRKV